MFISGRRLLYRRELGRSCEKSSNLCRTSSRYDPSDSNFYASRYCARLLRVKTQVSATRLQNLQEQNENTKGLAK